MPTQKNKFFTPLFIPLASLACGIYLQISFFNSITSIALFLAGMITSSAIITLRYPTTFSFSKIQTASFSLLFFFIGTLVVQLQKNEYRILRSELQGKNLTLTGILIDKEVLPDNKERLVISTQKIINHSSNCIKNKCSIVQCYTKYPTTLIVSDLVTIHNIAIPPEKHETRQPSFNDYLAKEGIHASFFLPTTQQISLESRPPSSWRRAVWELRKNILQSINKKITTPDAASLFNLIFLGQKQIEEIDILRNVFANWGINHYLARSGLHVALLIGMWSLLLMIIPINLRYKNFLTLIFTLIYAFLSWSSTSFFRALSVVIFITVGKSIWRQTSMLHLLSLVCMIMLLVNPFNLFFLDFQLTFGLTFALLISNAHIKKTAFFS